MKPKPHVFFFNHMCFLFGLTHKLNIAVDINCRNSDHKIADLEHLRNILSIRYFLG